MLSQDTVRVLNQYWKDLGTPCAHALRTSVTEGNWGKVDKILGSLDQQKWMSPSRHRLARCAIDIIKKADYLPIDRDQGKACIESFLKAEDICRATNYRMMLVEMNHSTIPLSKMQLVKRIRRQVKRILGPAPDIQYIEGVFGPGATLSNPRSKSSIYEKLSVNNPTITLESVDFYQSLPSRLRDCWGPSDQLTYVKANRFTMVPKNYKTHRGICIEPLINAYIQRCFGLYIKKRLRNIGVDIDTASEKHREIARLSSVSGEFATIDMSMASDTVSYGFVKMVLPHDWFVLLDKCRSRFTDLTDVYDDYYDLFRSHECQPIHRNEKFSSMGNGFTFELETTLFIAIARACNATGAISFGDDLIVKSDRCADVLDALSFCGFVPNAEKTFTSGSFRESCGGDYRSGTSVKGITLKTEPKCIEDWYDLHNRLYLMDKEYHLGLRRTLNTIRCQVPQRFRLSIPEQYGSGGFFDDNPRGRYVNSILRYKTYRRKTYQSNNNWYEEFDEVTMLAAILLGGSSAGPVKTQKVSRRIEWDPPII